MNRLRVPLRVVLYREDDEWVAHCLEFDLMGSGETRELAAERLIDAIDLQVGASLESHNPANLFKPADGRFFAMFAAGEDFSLPQFHGRLNSVIDEAEAREYAPA